MKKKVLLAFMAVTMIVSAAFAASVWIKVSDPCGRCVMNDTTRKCGKCGGFMASVDGTGKSVGGGFVQYKYQCNKCGHTNVYKNK